MSDTTIQLVFSDVDQYLTDALIEQVQAANDEHGFNIEAVEPGAHDAWLSVGMYGAPGSWQCSDPAELPLILDELAEAATYRLDFPDVERVFYDIEVYPNLFLVGWKPDGVDEFHYAINPPRQVVARLLELPLTGFNSRKYDNHVMLAYARGEKGQAIFNRSSRLTTGTGMSGTLPEAFGLGYTDVYDFSTKKQSLKKWEIELGLDHMEMDIPWHKPVSAEDISRVVDYNKNDVYATEKVFYHLKEDWAARQILARVADLPVSSSTNQLTTRIILGENPPAESPFVWSDLSKTFPGYEWRYEDKQVKRGGKPVVETKCVSTYLGRTASEGGYVYTQPGIHHNVILLDVASLHPASLIALNAFGPYTARFKELRDARIAVKHGDVEALKTLLNGALMPFVSDDHEEMAALAYALKIAINSVYGMTSASFPNMLNGKCYDREKNPDNIVAKRGALFMIALQEFCEQQGWTVVHIKTDSIKLANGTDEMIDAVMRFGERYGYEFEHEATYDRMCLIDKAQYAAHDADGWHFTGAKFLDPIVQSNVFGITKPRPEDSFVKKQVAGGASMYLGDEHVGAVGLFAPVHNGRSLTRVAGEKRGAVAGTKGFSWELADRVRPEDVDPAYAEKVAGSVVRTLSKYGDANEFVTGVA